MGNGSSCDLEAMAANEKPSEIIQKARRKLTDVLQTDPEAVLSAVDAHLLITEREYFTLSQINDPQKLIVTLIETVLEKGELAHEQFLDCMENLQHTFPGLGPISEYLEDDPNNGTENPEAAVFSEKKNGPEDPEMVVSSVKKNLPESPKPNTSSENGNGAKSPEPDTSSENRNGAKSPEPDTSSEKKNRAESPKPNTSLENRNGAESPEPDTSSEKKNRAESPEPDTSSEKGNGAESPEPDTSSEKGNGAESLEPDTSSEKGNGAESPEPDTSLENRNGAESPEPDTSSEKGNGAESPEPDTSSEKGNGAESPEPDTSSEKGNRAESPEAIASSEKGKESEILEASATSEKGKGVKSLEVPPTLEKENSEEQLFLQAQNELIGPWSQTNMAESATAGDLLAARTIEKEPEGATPSRTPAKGTCDLEKSADEKPSEIIRNKRKKLIEILQKDLELILDELLSQSIVTEEEYNTLDKTEEDPKKKIRKLLILIQKKGESACQQFLDCLEIVFPGYPQSKRTPHLISLTMEAENDLIFLFNDREEKADILQAPELTETTPQLPKDSLIQEQEVAIQQDPEQKQKDLPKERRKAFREVLSKLKLQKYESRKLRMNDILEISSGSLKDWNPQKLRDLPWHFLRKVMALNMTARSTSLRCGALHDQGTRVDEEEQGINEQIFFVSDTDTKVSLNPLDVLCAVLLCSDSFLQQEILSKMSMCQFALPLLLPALATPRCTLLLWAMRDIVRKWRPHSLADSRGFREESLVFTSMPTISFVRMGSCSFSKSKLLSEVLSPSQQYHDFFIHRDMESGNIPREIADGLVEISWFFPGGRKNLDLFPEPVAVTNLRGDIESHWLQFSFLTEVSSAVFIFAENITEREYTLLSSLKESTTKYYFILNHQTGKSSETLAILNKLAPVLKLKNSHMLMKDSNTNKAKFVEKLQSTIRSIMNSSPKRTGIEDMAGTARELGIQIDEDHVECQTASDCVKEITTEIKDVAYYKQEMLRLQGDLWKSLAKVEKEMCRMRRQGDIPAEKYKSQLKDKMLDLRKQQNKCDLTDGLTKFIDAIQHLLPLEKHYFLKWMKFQLDHIARGNLSKLRAEYKEKCKSLGDDPKQLAELDKLISSTSLGVEHFMRELGQFYEAECSMVKEGKILKSGRQFTHLPDIAADLLLEGFPIELIDGDASNIPLQWVTDVLTQLHAKLGGRSRMLVLTVLGVQSTGKSTLLNTMFGLQFAVSSGRCTRGAFMLLIQVKEILKKELGCDFILVIDTEGLKAPELAKLEDSYQHDNELATLVIGLSDITIVNMAMENATEMKDILQIVVHAFLRMEKIGHKPNCQFVHQNVSDVSADEQNMRDRKHLLEQLNEMIKAAAKMEKLNKEIKFSDIMEYDLEKNNWYIPGLWHGVPPMAPVNMGYSEKVYELKRYLFEFIRNCSLKRTPKDIPQFTEWVKSLWNAVKHENFIFSFRNSLIAEAYNQLSVKYSEWEWGFRKEMHLWITEKETAIHNFSPDELEADKSQYEMQQKLQCGEQRILELLKQYFESGAANLHLIEKYREDFIRSAKSLKNELESYSFKKCKEAIHIKKGQHKIANIQAEYMKVIEGKVDMLLEQCRKKESKLENKELEMEFEKMWKETFSELSPVCLQKHEIHEDIEFHLRKDLDNRGSSVNQKIQEAGSLMNYRINSFTMRNEYLDFSFTSAVKHWFTKKQSQKTEKLAKSLMAQCNSYIEERVCSKADYDETYCRELLHLINEKLQQEEMKKLQTSVSFEVDLKLHILGEAAHAFQKMHEDFLKENDPQQRLEKLKPQYFSIFKDHYLEKDARQNRARDLCDQCLKPALMDYVSKRLGLEIVDDILSSGQSIEYASRSFFQFTVQKKLLEDGNFNNYVKYIINYEKFVKAWIWRHILDYYREAEDLEALEEEILSTIIKKARDALEKAKDESVKTVSAFLNNFCKVLQKDLVISKDILVGIQFKNTADPDQFSTLIQTFLPSLQQQLLAELKDREIRSKLSHLPLKPQDEIFKRVFGCGKQCPFCTVPCEAGGGDHREHFASVHRPQGLGGYRSVATEKLTYSLCSSDVISSTTFRNSDTDWKDHPYKGYRQYYPDWRIQPDPSISASDYWKFVFKEFNQQFAKEYGAKPADLPTDWQKITKEQALESLKEAFTMK
ncbi:interferon-induced very large GTPase 1 isoform X2 [Chelonia mydas]|uniref:interferon-induced very large GTPase 1 isoform X2 n=1 Tax=Chelonia mydas TaxID=8469 RepID=UPI0018A21EEF|nr:interferon-induced very large GTPase 1 isoform X2 [Chelonia mydas]